MKKKKTMGLVEKRDMLGYTFVAHWAIGLLLFFILPVLTSIRYSFNDVDIGNEGVVYEFAGLKHFKYILVEDPNFVNNMRDSITSILYSLPIILALSLILAVVLNQKFRGRTFFRAVFFLPVIFGSSVIMTVLTSQEVNASLFVAQSGAEYTYGGLIDFRAILSELNLPDQISTILQDLLSDVFGIIWSCGVQTILFLAGLQSIPISLYEVSKVEGASKWEEFWFITIPSLRNIITLVIIYTMIQLLTATDNSVMQQAFILLRDKLVYDVSSAMLWFYFIIVLIVIGAVIAAYQHFAVKRWE